MATPDQKQLESQNKATQELSDIQKPRKVGTKVGLGVIHEDLQKVEKALTTTGKQPKQDREQLPVTMGRYKLDPKNAKDAELLAKIEAADREQNQPAEQTPTAETTAESETETDAERTERLTRIGQTIQGKIEAERGGTLNTTQTAVNNKVFENFIEQTRQREDLLKDATAEQLEIFQRLEDTLIELREANSEDSEKLRRQIAELGGELSETADTKAKTKMQALVGQSQQLAKPPTVTGSLGQMVRGNFRAGGAGLLDALAFKNEAAIERRMASAPPGTGWAPWRREDKRTEAGALTGILRQLKGDRPAPDRKPSWQEKVRAGAFPATALTNDIKPAAAVMPSTVSIENIDTLNVSAKKVNLSGELADAMAAGDSNTFIDLPDRGGPRTRGASPSGSPKPGAAKAKPSSSWWSKSKNFARGAWEGTKNVGSKIGAARALTGIGAMLYSADVGAGSDVVPEAGSKEAADLEAFRTKQMAEINAAKPAVQPKSKIAVSEKSESVSGTLKGVTGEQIQSHPNFKKYYEQAIKEGADKQTAYEDAADQVKVDMVKAQQQTTAAPKTQGETVKQQTTVNQDLKKSDNKPIVVPVPTPAPASAAQNGSSVQLPRGNMRPTESAYDRYVNRTSKF